MITLRPTLGDVQRGLREREFFLFYQPKIAFATGRVVGAEALLRWIPPGKTPIRPASFLPIAEQNGLGQEILPAMLPQLLADIRQIRAIAPDLRISFNVTAEDLRTPYLSGELESALDRHLIERTNLDIEITETVLMDGNPAIARTVDDLVQLGIELVMDDFGTGYSSLDVLSRYPFSGLKIDQGVVGRMSLAPRNAHIVRSGLVLARELGLRTVAEGIENEATYIYLSALGCREGQGTWISEPLSLAKFEDLLRNGKRWPASELGNAERRLARARCLPPPYFGFRSCPGPDTCRGTAESSAHRSDFLRRLGRSPWLFQGLRRCRGHADQSRPNDRGGPPNSSRARRIPTKGHT